MTILPSSSASRIDRSLRITARQPTEGLGGEPLGSITRPRTGVPPLKAGWGAADRAGEMEDRPAETRPPRVQSVAAQRFGAGAFAGRSPQKTQRRAEGLHVCPTCASELVIPVDWAPAPSRQWRVELRCPNCEWTGGGVYS